MVWSFFFMIFSMFFTGYHVELFFMSAMSIVLLVKLYFVDVQFEMDYFFLDAMSMNMSHLSIVLACLSISCYYKSYDARKAILCFLSGAVAYLFFHSSNLMMFFVLFELSLLPLVVLIVGWGKQPERILASKYMIMYTILSSFPLLCLTIYVELCGGLFSMVNELVCSNYYWSFWPLGLNFLAEVSFMLAFLMKVPLFFLHSWLPKAHVEAPLEGSIILAGIMLKVGMFGIIRMINLFQWNYSLVGLLLFVVSILGSILSMLMAVSSDDLKLSVALSSVSHMNFLMSSIVSGKDLIVHVANLTMISHGFSSSMLFFFVTLIYEMNNSRSVAVVKGSMSKFPPVLFMAMAFFSLSIAIPPSITFLGEMMGISLILSFSGNAVVMFSMFMMVNSFFGMMSYGILNQSSINKFPVKSYMDILFNVNGVVFLMVMVVGFFFPESLV